MKKQNNLPYNTMAKSKNIIFFNILIVKINKNIRIPKLVDLFFFCYKGDFDMKLQLYAKNFNKTHKYTS